MFLSVKMTFEYLLKFPCHLNWKIPTERGSWQLGNCNNESIMANTYIIHMHGMDVIIFHLSNFQYLLSWWQTFTLLIIFFARVTAADLFARIILREFKHMQVRNIGIDRWINRLLFQKVPALQSKTELRWKTLTINYVQFILYLQD